MIETAGTSAIAMLEEAITAAGDLARASRRKRMDIHSAPESERMQLASEAMNASMEATETLAGAVQLAFNMLKYGMQATVSRTEPAAFEGDLTP